MSPVTSTLTGWRALVTVAVFAPAMTLKSALVEYSKVTVPKVVARVHNTVEVWVVSPLATLLGKAGCATGRLFGNSKIPSFAIGVLPLTLKSLSLISARVFGATNAKPSNFSTPV